MFARVMRVVDFPLLLGPTKTLICSSNSNVISSKGPILVTCKSRIGIARSPGIASPSTSQPAHVCWRGKCNIFQGALAGGQLQRELGPAMLPEVCAASLGRRWIAKATTSTGYTGDRGSPLAPFSACLAMLYVIRERCYAALLR